MDNKTNRKIILNKLGFKKLEENTIEKKPLIEINDLSVNFIRGGKLFEAVKSANLKINENDIVGIVGESGSGKTTLGRATISLWDHAKGEVKIDGKTLPKKRIRSVSDKNVWVYELGQIIFQDPTSSLNRQQKVLDIVSEGIKNFKTVQNESLQKIKDLDISIKEIDHKIRLIEDKDYRKKFSTQEAIEKKFSNLLLTSNNKNYNKYVDDYVEHLKLQEELAQVEEELSKVKENTNNEIEILKKQVKSDKLTIKEENESDWGFFKNAIKESEEEFEKISERYKTKPERVEGAVGKRIEDFIKYINKQALKLDQKTLKEVGFKTATSDPKKNEETIVSLDKWLKDKKAANKKISDKDNISEKEKKILDENRSSIAIVGSLYESIKLMKLKKEKVVSIYNTRAFDFLYEFIDGKVANRVNYLRNLVDDLDKRVLLEKSKWSTYLKNNKKIDDIHEMREKSHSKALDYLSEYRTYLISQVIEYRVFRVNYKTWLQKSFKAFSKYIKDTNYRFELLSLSLATWKGESRKDYIKRNSEIFIKELNFKKITLKKSIKLLEDKYDDIENILDNLFKFFGKEIEKINNIEVKGQTPEIYSEELRKLKLQKTIKELKKDSLEPLTKEGAFLDEEIERRIIQTLKIVGLNEEAINKFPDQFSGGQKQRIGIARTLISKPKLIIADEPISALDVSVQAQVINLLKELHSKLGLTMMFIAHDLEMVHYISTKIVVIYRGNIVEYGDADKVYKSPKHPYTQSLIAAMPSLKIIGKPLKVSEYKWSDHAYNEFSSPKLHKIETDHFVFGTEKEIKEWTKK